MSRWGRTNARSGGAALRLLPLLTLLAPAAGCAGGDRITVGSKYFTESIILGEIVALALEREGFEVDHRKNLGGTFVCHEALINGQIDLYVEYTGTAHTAILKLPVESQPRAVYAAVDSAYRERWRLEWTEPLGFENTFAMLIRRAEAQRLGISTLSQAAAHAPNWKPAWSYEFDARVDGAPGLQQAYGLRFAARPTTMDMGLLYRALAEGQADIVAGNSTDGQIDALGLFMLRDDKHYFPPYEAAPVVRQDLLERHPEVRDVLRRLGDLLDEEMMRRLNYQVDVEKKSARQVARDFLETARVVRGER